MSNPSLVSLQLPAGVTNGIALAQAVAGAKNLTLNGSLVTSGVANLTGPGAGAQRVVAVSANAGDNTQILTITGLNISGAAISEKLALNGVTQVNSIYDYASVSNIAINAATAGNITAGTDAIGSTPWVLDNFLSPGWYLSVAVSLTGTVNYTVEHTYDDPNTTPTLYSSMEPASNQPPLVWANATLAAKTANGEAQYANWPIFAHRLTINSGNGKAIMQSIQAGIGST